MGVAPLVAAVVLAVSPVSFVQAHATGGAYAEPGGTSDALLTSWAVLGLRAAGAGSPGSLAYLQSQESSLQTSNDVAIVALAEQALGDRNDALLARLRVQAERADRRDAQLDLLGRARARSLDRPRRRGSCSPSRPRRRLRVVQARPGRLERHRGGPRGAAGGGRPRRGRSRGPSASCARSSGRDGGFELTRGRGSDAQSTAWAIQGLVAAGRTPPRSAFAYLARHAPPDGSYRYSAKYVTTPVWVTSQVLAALAKKPFPCS